MPASIDRPLRYFILYAHPEPALSFNGAMLANAVTRLEAAGHEARVSNLYTMGFEAVARSDDFAERRFPDRLQYDREQKHAAANQLLAPDIAAELEKLFWCDVFVLQFPLYWFSMPAIMKGWFDRVFVNSVVYGAGKRYETGGLKGRRAMVATTTGAYAPMFEPDGLLGDINRALWHIHNGILFYTGFEVMAPFVGWSPIHSPPEANDASIARYADRLLAIPADMPLAFHPTSDFDTGFKLKPDLEPRSHGHWRP